MMSCAFLVGFLAMASAENQFPFTGLDSQASTRASLDEKCEPEANFFSKEFGSVLLEHPEFDKSNVKIALGRNMKYIQVDQPFSHEANRLSLAQVDIPEEEDEDAKASKLRAKIRQQHAWSSKRMEEAEIVRMKELAQEKREMEEVMRKQHDVKVDVYYVNMDNQKERKNCLERQFKDMPGHIVPKRFQAIKFPDKCAKSKTHSQYEECLKEAELGDCFESGIDYSATGTHGTRDKEEHKIRSAVISNWCGHKRLFKQLDEERQAGNGTAPQYVVVLEDDVILDRKYFMKVIKDFATNYENKNWDVVQLDPFGHKDRKDYIEQFRGKPVWSPAADSQCSQYWGFHAVLVKTSALPRINKWMANHQAVPIDWMPWRMPHVLAYSALVSRNPEAQLGGNVVVLPQYCSQKVMKSTIG